MEEELAGKTLSQKPNKGKEKTPKGGLVFRISVTEGQAQTVCVIKDEGRLSISYLRHRGPSSSRLCNLR